jgi:hypothetical protein
MEIVLQRILRRRVRKNRYEAVPRPQLSARQIPALRICISNCNCHVPVQNYLRGFPPFRPHLQSPEPWRSIPRQGSLFTNRVRIAQHNASYVCRGADASGDPVPVSKSGRPMFPIVPDIEQAACPVDTHGLRRANT